MNWLQHLLLPLVMHSLRQQQPYQANQPPVQSSLNQSLMAPNAPQNTAKPQFPVAGPYQPHDYIPNWDKTSFLQPNNRPGPDQPNYLHIQPWNKHPIPTYQYDKNQALPGDTYTKQPLGYRDHLGNIIMYPQNQNFKTL